MRKITFTVLSIVTAVPLLLWLSGDGFGGAAFQKPGIPQGAKVQGPAAKGAITLIVSYPGTTTPWATVEFHGQCTIGDGKNAVTQQLDTPKLDVTQITDYNFIAAATPQAIADSVENFFTDNSTVVNPAHICWSNAFAVYVQAVNGAGTKTAVPGTTPTTYIWTGDSTLKGVNH
jgi:hypothetical protein